MTEMEKLGKDPVNSGGCLFFVHIPKTGGATFRKILGRLYASKKIFWVNLIQDRETFKTLSGREKSLLDAVAGHFPYGLHEQLPHRGHRYITFLRDPVERCLSHYYHVLRTPENYLYTAVVKGGMTFKDFVSSNISIEMDNLQCRIVSGLHGQIPWGQVDEKCLSLAKKRLRDDFEIFGLTERFDESVFLMARRFGWKVGPYGRSNVGVNKPESRPKNLELIRLIRSRNAADVELFQYANELFEQRIRLAGGRHPIRFFLCRRAKTFKDFLFAVKSKIKSILRFQKTG